MKIKRTKRPDVLTKIRRYDGGEVLCFGGKKIFLRGYLNLHKEVDLFSVGNGVWKTFTYREAKELSKVLPKFLEEMERETK